MGNKLRVPFHQIFRFEFRKFSYVEWNGILHHGWTDLVLFLLEHISRQELLDNMLHDCYEVAVLRIV